MTLIQRVPTDFGRLYWVPEHQLLFPSVTTVLGIKPDPRVEKIRQELGEDKFNEISFTRANRGSCMHLYLENFLIYKKTGKENSDCLQWTLEHTCPELIKQGFTEKEITSGRNLFWNFWYDDEFFQDIEDVISTEEFLYSLQGRFGGTTDFFYRSFTKLLKFTDFKSSTYTKSEEDIDKYKMQISAYIKAYFERTGKIADLGQIIISNQDQESLSKFYLSIEEVDHWYQEFQKLVSLWFELNEEKIVTEKQKLSLAGSYIIKEKIKPLF